MLNQEQKFVVRDAAVAILVAALATVVAWFAQRWLGLSDLSMVFIVAVVLVASRTRMTGAVVAATLCFLSYNFFFLAPRFTFYIRARQGVVTVFLFLVAALVAGRLAAKLRAQVLALRAINAHTTALQTLARDLGSAADLGQAMLAGREALERLLHIDAVVRIGDQESRSPRVLPWNADDRAAADWAQLHRRPAGRSTDSMAVPDWWFIPFGSSIGNAGVIGLRIPIASAGLAPEQCRLAVAMTDDIAQAVLRTRLVADLEEARVSGETERLRSALLSSVSHDLRSPLASIIGAASSLDHYSDAMGSEDRHSLHETIRLEGERLDRYIQNLLDMTRLGHGGLALKRDWIGVDELIGSAVMRLHRYQPSARFEISVEDDLVPIWVHPALVEQALFNVLENAAHFSPPDGAVGIAAGSIDGKLRIDIRDSGPGIPEDERKRVFDMFYSVERGDRGRQGTGLGLAICQGMIGAHGGTVEALPGPNGRGTVIRISLPPVEPAAIKPSAIDSIATISPSAGSAAGP